MKKGVVGGRERWKMKQVTKTAEVTGFPRGKAKRASVAAPKTITRRSPTRDRQPKRWMEKTRRGIRE
jgi:hypothetical protein